MTDEQIDAIEERMASALSASRGLRAFARAVLAAQPAPAEPVAWRRPGKHFGYVYEDGITSFAFDPSATPLYVHPPAQPAPVPCARNELVTAIHSLASNFENSLYAFRNDTAARRKATGDIAHAIKIAAKHNQNGPGCSAAPVPVPPEWKLVPVEPTPEMILDGCDAIKPGGFVEDIYAAMIAASPEKKP